MSDYEFLKLCAARYVYRRRRELTPSSVEKMRKYKTQFGITWEQWWERKFNDNFADYVKRTAEERRASRAT